MKFSVMTLFPDMIHAVLDQSIIGRAQKKGAIELETHNIRDYTQNKQKHPAYPENARKSELKLQFFLRLKNASNLESAIF